MGSCSSVNKSTVASTMIVRKVPSPEICQKEKEIITLPALSFDISDRQKKNKENDRNISPKPSRSKALATETRDFNLKFEGQFLVKVPKLLPIEASTLLKKRLQDPPSLTISKSKLSFEDKLSQEPTTNASQNQQPKLFGVEIRPRKQGKESFHQKPQKFSRLEELFMNSLKKPNKSQNLEEDFWPSVSILSQD